MIAKNKEQSFITESSGPEFTEGSATIFLLELLCMGQLFTYFMFNCEQLHNNN